jgi:hypothetical protein
MTGPMPGTDCSSSAFSIHAGDLPNVSSIWPSISASSFSSADFTRAMFFFKRLSRARFSRWLSAPTIWTI